MSEKESKQLLINVKGSLPQSKLLLKAHQMESHCKDFSLKSGDLLFVKSKLADDSTIMNLTGCSLYMNRLHWSMSQHAFSQICGKLAKVKGSKEGIPVKYMKKCLSVSPYLFVSNMNTWLKESADKPLFMRTYSNRVRGVLSDKYAVLDTPEILGSVSKLLPNYVIKNYYLDEERLHVRLINPTPISGVKDTLMHGIQIDSSDVGSRILTVKFFIYRLACTNGLIVSLSGGNLFEQKHIGITNEEFRDELSTNLDIIPELVGKSTLAIQNAMDNKIDKEYIPELIDSIKTIMSLSEEDQKKIIDLTAHKYGYTKWGAVNALTEVAQTFSLDRRLDMEQLAGQVLSA